MPTYTANIGITKLVEGQESAHVTVNEAFDVIDKTIAGALSLDLSGLSAKTLTGAESSNAIIRVTATTMACTVTMQAVPKIWSLINDGTHAVTVQCSGQSSPPVAAAGSVKVLVCDGAVVRLVG
jgi:hypothetical protein